MAEFEEWLAAGMASGSTLVTPGHAYIFGFGVFRLLRNLQRAGGELLGRRMGPTGA